MKLLKRVRLINWHVFTDELIELDRNLYAVGANESGKSSLLDALQFALIPDLRRVHFNASAHQSSRDGRKLESYARCKIQDRYWRQEATAIVALEFVEEDDRAFVVGGIVDAHEDASEEHAYFIFNNCELNDDLFFFRPRQPCSRKQFHARLQDVPEAKFFPSADEYGVALLNRLGRLNSRFFDLFVKAYFFKDVENIEDFVLNYLLDPEPVDIEKMRKVQERLSHLDLLVRQVIARIQALQQITGAEEQRMKAARNLRLHDYLVCSAQCDEAREALETLLQKQVAQKAEINNVTESISTAEVHHYETEAELEKVQHSLFGNEHFRERQDLETSIERAQSALEALEAQRSDLLVQLKAERSRIEQLLTLVGPAMPVSQLVAPVQRFQIWLNTLPASINDTDAAIDQIVAGRDALNALTEWARTETVREQVQCETNEKQLDQKQAELANLQGGGKASLPSTAQKLRAILAAELATEPLTLSEMLTSVDDGWQDAVEGMLGSHRHAFIVPAAHYEQCMRAYERERNSQGISGIGVVDVERLRAHGRPAQKGSLATKVHTEADDARRYVDHLLGNVTCCETVEAMRNYQRAVTRSCMVYRQFMVDHMDPNIYQRWFIGRRGYDRQFQLLTEEISDLRQNGTRLANRVNSWQALVGQAKPSDSYLGWRQTLLLLKTQKENETQLRGYQEKLWSTDWADVDALQSKVTFLKSERDKWSKVKQQLGEQRAKAQVEQDRLAQDEKDARIKLETREIAVWHIEDADTAEWSDEARRRYQETLQQSDISTILKNYSAQRVGDETRLRNAEDELRNLQSQYQRDFNFYVPPISPGSDSMGPYMQELARLEATDLPQYQQEVAQAKHEAEIEFRENFIHELRDKIRSAKRQLDNINQALRAVPFAGTTYQFKSTPAPRYLKFYHLIVEQDSESLGRPLLEGGFLDKHQDEVDELFHILTSQTPGVAADEVEHLRDYRHYLTYDIELQYSDGHKASFNKIGRSQSGGKTQTPFYVTVVAAFAQLYHVQEPHLSDTARIIVFDEAFSKMDGQHIASALALMRKYDLQVVTATPPGKYDDIAPYMETCLSIVRSGNRASIQPFYNREAGSFTREKVKE